jgi:hypothetical protein
MAQVKDPVTRPNGGNDRSHQIEADIDRTRAAMDRTVDAIAGKLTPQQLMLECLGVFKDGSSALATRLVQTAREHPVPATIIGIGIGLLLTESARGGASAGEADSRHRNVGFGGYGEHPAGEPSVRTEGFAAAARGKTEAMKDSVTLGAMEAREKVGETAAHVKQQAAHVKDQVVTQAAHLKEQVAEGTEHVREQAAQVPVYARQQWRDAQLGFWQTMDQKPFAIGIAALAAGVAAGLTVPASRRENELMGETRDRLLDQARDLGREAVDKGKQVARATTEVVKTEVARQGLQPGAIAEKVRTIGREAEEALKSEAEKVVPEPLKATGTPMTGGGQGASSPGGAAGRGMSAGFASTPESPAGVWDPDSTVPGAGNNKKTTT